MELPQLEKEEQKRIENHLRRACAGKSHVQLIVFTTLLAYENARLVTEVNRLRPLAGEEPMKVYEPGQ